MMVNSIVNDAYWCLAMVILLDDPGPWWLQHCPTDRLMCLHSLSQLSHSVFDNSPWQWTTSRSRHVTIIHDIWCFAYIISTFCYAPNREPRKYGESHPLVHPWKGLPLLLLVISLLFVMSCLVAGSIHFSSPQLTHWPTIVAYTHILCCLQPHLLLPLWAPYMAPINDQIGGIPTITSEVSRAFNSLGAMYAAGWGTEKSKTLGRSVAVLGWEAGVGRHQSCLAEVPRRTPPENHLFSWTHLVGS